MHANRPSRFAFFMASLTIVAALFVCAPCQGGVTREEVERSIRDGVRYLKEQQNKDGSWNELDERTRTGVTSLVTLALLTAGEKPSTPEVHRALEFLRKFGPDELGSTYAIGLQTMVYALAEPERDQLRIAANVNWLEQAQIQKGDRVPWPGSWSYSDTKRPTPGDNSNTQYALLGLHAASEVGVPVKAQVWVLARQYWESAQKFDGSFTYTPEGRGISTASMTCAGISSLVISGLRRYEGQEFVQNGEIHNCGKGGVNRNLQAGINWISEHFHVGQNLGAGPIWKFYYLYGLERAGRLTGMRFFGNHDWYRLGAEELVHEQQPFGGFWQGAAIENNRVLATSFALLFLAKGRAPVLINKLRYGPRDDGNLRGREVAPKDWNNDADDVRNLVNIVQKDWKNLLTWQVVDPNIATVPEMLQAPIVFFNGHRAPEFTANAKRNIREYIEEGGFLFADACCSSLDFDQGFKQLMKEIFPEEEYKLRPLSEDHPIWRAKHLLNPEVHPLWGIEHGCRTVVIYSPKDLSCFWNQAEHSSAEPAVIKAIKVGQNVIDYATGREMPADKLTIRETRGRAETPKRDALWIGKLKHAGDWNIAPQAIPNLMDALRKPPYSFNVVLKQKDLSPRDPYLMYYPLIYIHGRAALSFGREDLEALRRHLDTGTIFADAACGATAFDGAFRRFVAELLPNNPLVAIPRDDEIFTTKVGTDLSKVRYTKGAGGGQNFPQLEGVKINDHWVIIYSKYDIGCALERHTGIECKGYTYESAIKIAGNIVLYSMLP
jgi:hypothetical protein